MESLVTALEAGVAWWRVRWVELSSILSYWPEWREWREQSRASSPHRYPSTYTRRKDLEQCCGSGAKYKICTTLCNIK
jgi:hypothetical protein